MNEWKGRKEGIAVTYEGCALFTFPRVSFVHVG